MDVKSNEPFWLLKNGLIQSYPSLWEDAECDVLVVGGGITGSLIAHQCVKEGYKTILMDKREVANGSSSATTAMLQYEIDTPLYRLSKMIGNKGALASYRACSKAIDQLGKICKQIASKAGFEKKSSLYFAAFKKDLPELQMEFEARKDAGFEVSWLHADDIQKKYGLTHTWGGILSQQGGSVDAFMLVHELLEYNIKKGLAVYDKTELTKVQYGARVNEAILHTGAKIKAKKIVYCVGYESTLLIKEKFVDLISTYAVVSEVESEWCARYKDLLIWNTADPYIYVRTTDDGRMLIGGEDEEFKDPVKRDDLIAQKEKKLMASFKKYFPDNVFKSDFVWAGTFGKTKDGLPYIGEHPDFNNSFFVLGFGGNGITFSVTGMEMVSYWLKRKEHPLNKWFHFGR